MELALTPAGGGRGDTQGAPATLEVADETFGVPYNEPLVHQIVTAYMAGGRAGTKAQKSRSDVRGGGSKPWRQKGTGRARAGSIRSPIWRGGGATFAARPRSFAQKVNRKMYRGALRSILSELLRQDRLRVIENFPVEDVKTGPVARRLRALGLSDVLLVTEKLDEKLSLSVRNLPWAAVVASAEVNPVNLLAFDTVLVTSAAMRRLEGRLGRGAEMGGDAT